MKDVKIEAHSYTNSKYLEVEKSQGIVIEGQGVLTIKNNKNDKTLNLYISNESIKIQEKTDKTSELDKLILYTIFSKAKKNSKLEPLTENMPIIIDIPDQDEGILLDLCVYAANSVGQNIEEDNIRKIYAIYYKNGELIKPILMARSTKECNGTVEITEDAKKFKWL